MTDDLEDISESDYEDGPPCADCGHSCLDHDDEFGDCAVRDDAGICDCKGYREPDEDAE